MTLARPGQRLARALEIRGVVQGVGFRPFVWRLATELGLDGTVINRAGQVEVEIAGTSEAVEAFERRVRADAPPRSRVEAVVVRPAGRDIAAGSGFAIEESEAVASTERLFPPDIATCDDCLRELFDPNDRRYRYPFTNCTNCGPRFTIIESLPYDRERTTMRAFALCDDCRRNFFDKDSSSRPRRKDVCDFASKRRKNENNYLKNKFYFFSYCLYAYSVWVFHLQFIETDTIKKPPIL